MSHSFMIVCGELIVYQEDIECPFFTQKNWYGNFIHTRKCTPFFYAYFSAPKTQKKIKKTKNKMYIKAGTSFPRLAAIIVIG